MRKSRLTADEIEATERAADERKYRRGMGFDLMSVRDRGWADIGNGMIMEWPVDRTPADYEARSVVPPNHFILRTNKETLMLNADDFRKYLRWV